MCQLLLGFLNTTNQHTISKVKSALNTRERIAGVRDDSPLSLLSPRVSSIFV